MHFKDADRMANSVDPGQTAPSLGLHCLPRPVCLKSKDHYDPNLSYIIFIPLNLYPCILQIF